MHVFMYSQGVYSLVASSVHPFHTALSSTYSKNTPEAMAQFRQFLLEKISEEFLSTSSGTLHPYTLQTMGFLLDLFDRTLNKEEIAVDATVLLSPVMSCMLMSEVGEVHLKTTAVLQHLVENCQKYSASLTM
jgi:hypothetical protein